jgi:hypothetical protein
MLDPDAQKSLLENAATVNQAMLDVCEANVTEYTKKVATGTDAEKKLYEETFGKEAQQSLKIRDFIGSIDTVAITDLEKLMKQREKDDEVVEEKLKIAKVASTVSSTFRSSQTLKDLLGGEYFKDGDEKVYIHKNSTTNPTIVFSLPVKSDTPDEDYEFICMEFNFKNNTRETLSFTKHDAYGTDIEYENFNMSEKGKPEYKEMFAKKEKDEYFMAWSAAVKVTTPAPPSGSAKLFTFKHAEPSLSYLPYEKKGTRLPTAVIQVLPGVERTELYLPILRDGNFIYLYVESKEDVDVKEIEESALPSGVAPLEIEGHEKDIENANPDFYNWWFDRNYIINPPKVTPAAVTRGSDNLIELWRDLTKTHGNKEVSYASLPVGALFFSATRKKYPKTLNGLSIVLETESQLAKKTDREPTHKLNITVTKNGEIIGTPDTAKLFAGNPKLKIMNAEDAITFLKIDDNMDKFEKLIASNSILATEFAVISTALPPTAPAAPTATAPAALTLSSSS